MLAPSVAHESDTWKGRCVNVQAAGEKVGAATEASEEEGRV